MESTLFHPICHLKSKDTIRWLYCNRQT